MSVAEVQSRIQQIASRFPSSVPTARAPLSTAAPRSTAPFGATAGATGGAVADTLGRDFARTLADAYPRTTTASTTSQGEQVVDIAKKYLGTPYVWGGTDPGRGLDCSGLVQQAFAEIGVDLPRVSRDQAKAGRAVDGIANAQPGDLVAFGDPVDHIGIYAGNNLMVVAPKRGDVVKVQQLYRTPSAIRRVLPDQAAAPVSRPVAPQSVRAAGGAQPFAALFTQAGARHGVSPALLTAVARAESGFDATARSPVGAQGLMQLMPATARELGVDPLDPASAVDGAARLLAGHLREFGSTDLALAAYNAGPGAVRRHGGIPPYAETQSYVRRITAELRGGA